MAVLALVLIPFADGVWRGTYDFLKMLPFDGFFSAAKQFAVGAVVGSILIAIWALDTPRRRTVAVCLVAILIPATVTQVLKHTLRRARPEYSVHMDDDARKWIEGYRLEYPGTAIRTDRTDQWLLLSSQPPFLGGRHNSFPSGHATAAFAFAAYLIVLYPRLGWLWLLWAIGCGLARVRFRQHFPEDVLFGGALGWLMAQWVFTWGWPARLGDYTARLFSRKTEPVGEDPTPSSGDSGL
ncbi:phosphatase PAP2 family protein [bacterium]|nr:phosphatase PAP2 family protein [bacterium]